MTASPKAHLRSPLLVILAFATLIRFAWAWLNPTVPVSDFAFYNQLAHQILSGSGMDSAFVGPGFPYSLAIVYSLFSDSLIAAKLFNVVLGVSTCLLTYTIALQCFNEEIALISTGLAAFLPSFIVYTGLLASENLFTPLLLLGVALFLHGTKDKSISWPWIVLSGGALGLASLVRPIAFLVPVPLFTYLLWNRVHIGKALQVSATLMICALMVLASWLIRNYRISGRLMLQTEGGITFLIGNYPLANGRYNREILVDWQEQVQRLGLDEYQADQLAYQQGAQFILEHPARWMALIPLKWFHLLKRDDSGVFWSFQSQNQPVSTFIQNTLLVISDGYYYLTILLAAAALAFNKTSQLTVQGRLLPVLLIIYWLGFHAFFFGMDRFHYPLMPFIMLLSAMSISGFRNSWSH